MSRRNTDQMNQNVTSNLSRTVTSTNTDTNTGDTSTTNTNTIPPQETLHQVTGM